MPQLGQAVWSMVTPDDEQLPPVFFASTDIAEAQAITDAGRPIPLMRYEAVAILPQGKQLAFQSEDQQRSFLAAIERKFLANTKQNPERLTKLVEAFPQANCHGWIFTGGQYGICDTLAPTVLADNGYAAVTGVQGGELVLYTHNGQIKHSGLVHIDATGQLLVESKWGPFGVYLHGLEAHPFGSTYTFYRSNRAGHRVTIAPRQ
jgi:hypothetical protein